MTGPPPKLATLIAADALALFCPAKINLALGVGPRNDVGMHPISSWMVPLAFGDTLELARLADADPSRFDLRFTEDAPIKGAIDWPLESDLAFRAHALLEQASGRKLPIAMKLRKRIPAGAGLGGGSANAAAMLDGLNRLFALGFDDEALAGFAGRLGSDVIFQLAARRHTSGAIVTGTGGVITPLPPAEPLQLILIFPGADVACGTAEVYRAFDATYTPRPLPDPDAMMRLAIGPLGEASLFNDLEAPAIAVQPQVGVTLEHLRQLGLAPHVTGSGSTVFVIVENDPRHAQSLTDQIKKTPAGHAILTHTLGG